MSSSVVIFSISLQISSHSLMWRSRISIISCVCMVIHRGWILIYWFIDHWKLKDRIIHFVAPPLLCRSISMILNILRSLTVNSHKIWTMFVFFNMFPQDWTISLLFGHLIIETVQLQGYLWLMIWWLLKSWSWLLREESITVAWVIIRRIIERIWRV